MSLYFISVVPHTELRKQVRKISKDFKVRFNSVKSYNNFPHITLVPPFCWNEGQEAVLIDKIQNLEIKTACFTQKLNGFGAFPNPKNPVIFIKPDGITEISELYQEVSGQVKISTAKKFSPHLTVAYRDLSPDNFKIAWEEYQDKAFSEEFLVDKICLFKHFNGKWNFLATKLLP